MFSRVPRYAYIISIAIPVGVAVLAGVLWLIPATRNPGNSLLAILVVFGLPFFFNTLMSLVAAALAAQRGRGFASFYFLGLVFTFVPSILVALVAKKRPTVSSDEERK